MTRLQSIPADAFNAYQAKRLAKLLGFGPIVALDRWLARRGIHQLPRYHARGDRVVFHPWRRGFVDVRDADPAPSDAEIARRNWTADRPRDVDALLVRALVDFAALQNPWELAALLERVAARPPRTILEIGTSCGGLLFALAQVAPADATLVSIDLPERMDTPATAAALPEVLRGLVQPTQTLHVFRERSTVHGVRADVQEALGGRALDLLVIDGDHSYGGVRSDLEMYGPLVGRGGRIALHDVLVRPENSGRGYDVGLYWDELRATRTTETLVDPDAIAGVLHQRDVAPEDRKPAALGWGLVSVDD